jgi:hypothetical protein
MLAALSLLSALLVPKTATDDAHLGADLLHAGAHHDLRLEDVGEDTVATEAALVDKVVAVHVAASAAPRLTILTKIALSTRHLK